MLQALARRGHPERHFVLTSRPIPNISWKEAVQRVRHGFLRLVQALRKEGLKFEYIAVLERHKNGAPHLHVLQRGSYVAKNHLTHLWKNLTGNHITWVGRVQSPQSAAQELTKYVAKTAKDTLEWLPNVPLYTVSRHWEIDRPEDSPNWDPREYRAAFFAVKPSELVATLRLCGATVLDPKTIADAFIVTTHPPPADRPPPEALNDLSDYEIEIWNAAQAVLAGPAALDNAKAENAARWSRDIETD